MEWAIAAILSSILLAVRSDVNRRFKLNGFRLNFWQSLFTTTAFLPFLYFLPWPEMGDLFYPIAAISSVITMMVITVKNNLSASHNGRVSNMEMPIKTFVLFFFWLLLDPEMMMRMLHNPLQSLGILSMLILGSYAMNKMRDSDTGWHTFVQIVPMALMASCGDALVKYVLSPYDGESLIPMTLSFIALTSIGNMLVSGSIIAIRPHVARPYEVVPQLIVPNMLKAALIMSGLTFFMLMLFFYALALAPNPAYVTALGMLTPIWLLIFHKWKKIPDNASPVMGSLLVLSALGLLLLATL